MFVAVDDPVPERRAQRPGDTLPDQGRVAGDGCVEGVPAVVGVAVELTRDRILEGAGHEPGLGEDGEGGGDGGREENRRDAALFHEGRARVGEPPVGQGVLRRDSAGEFQGCLPEPLRLLPNPEIHHQRQVIGLQRIRCTHAEQPECLGRQVGRVEDEGALDLEH